MIFMNWLVSLLEIKPLVTAKGEREKMLKTKTFRNFAINTCKQCCAQNQIKHCILGDRGC